MTDQNVREIEKALEIRREILHEIKHGGPSRRAMYRKLLFAGGALAALSQLRGNNAWAADDPAGPEGIAPPTRPFIEPLVHVNRPAYVKKPKALLPAPDCYAQTSAGGVAEVARNEHQAWYTHWAYYRPRQRKTYELTQRVVQAKIHRDLPLQEMWGYDGKVPGPTFHSRYGEPCIVRLCNELPAISEHRGFGCPETSMHLHNGHVPSESDGNPDDYLPRTAELNGQHDYGRFRDHHYPNIYAGNDPREALGTLWYHDHRHDFTAPNVYRGLAGFHLMFDEIDSGDENDPNPKALRLPSGEYDVPLMLGDRFINSQGQTVFDQFNFDGIIGNKYVVNGRIQPHFKVEPRKYRLRLLNGGVSRTFGLALMVSDSPQGLVNHKFIEGAFIIGTGGNLLPAPIPLRNPSPLGGSQRLDVVVDFAKVPRGKYVFLVNRWEQSDGREPEGYRGSGPDGPKFDLIQGHALMRFDVELALSGGYDPSQLPPKLRELPWQDNDALSRLTEDDILKAIGKSKPFPGVERVREWKFDRTNGQWAVNGQLFDGSTPAARVGKDTGEIWVLQGSGSWVHPVHLHMEEHRTLFREGIKPKPHHLEYGRDDTMLLGGGERGIMYRQFRDFKGKYVMHCHNVVHEDHAMMIRFDVE